jgi:murein DD-endopeptidase / murein LD-carboxypeptidase
LIRAKFFFFVVLFSIAFEGTGQNNVHADSLISFAKRQLGVKYKYGSTNPKAGFDCSGFVYYVFEHFSIKVPRASMDYEKAGKIIPADSCKAGDIIVFTGTNIKNRKPGHVGIIISNTGSELNFIHSSSGHKRVGVIITNFKDSPYYQSRFIKIVRLSVVR